MSGNLRKKEESQRKVREFDRLSEETPRVQLDDLSLCQVLYEETLENSLRSERSEGK